MVVDVRKLSIGSGPARPAHQHGHFCVRAFHRLISYPSYSLFILFLIYLQIMDIILYFKIRTRDPLDFNSSNQTNTQSAIHSVYIFNPLPIKKIMVEPIIHYVRSPLAESVETKLHFTYYFPFISANAVSFFHCFLSVVSMKFVASESFSRRQLGVLIFQFRTFLDCLDGVVFRAHSNNKRYKSYYGDFGYYVDALSDILGGTCLIIGCLLYFYKERPFRSKSTATINSSVSPGSSASDGSREDNDLMILNLEDDQSCSHAASSPRKNDLSSNLLETKRTIFITLLVFSLRYSISAFFWDRYVRLYEQLLDSQTDTLQQKTLQLSILHSPLTIVIFYLWRYQCALSLQDYLLFSIFIDRTWEFILKTSTIGWFALMLTAFLTELHVNQVQSLFAALTIG
ncbi:unnamed protein product [Rotaria socialis]|uniref:Ceramide phosphoethanolamine synthase n=1 Tax=Rotaria socialis TaxID=392032 RepID=A0A820LH84_9BILA|nr:unnamed protein product [Rotaria socialis]CAF3561490.1 unnamed protein product [Rotaria socialis]CAF4169158.1 unnamed protein product [Rotaria socialis]CAF4355558.1 unnamed protein product [Rotaria socialis]